MKCLNVPPKLALPPIGQRGYQISTSNHGKVVRSKKSKKQKKSHGPSPLEVFLGGITWAKWRRLWMAGISQLWMGELTPTERAWWGTQRILVPFTNYKGVTAYRTKKQLYTWYQFRRFDLDPISHIPFPAGSVLFPAVFTPPWTAPTLEEPTITSAIIDNPGATDENLFAFAKNAGGGNVPWEDPESVTNWYFYFAYATIDYQAQQVSTELLHVTEWEIDPPIPEGSNIVGIEVGVMCQEIGAALGIKDLTVRLMKAGVALGENKAHFTWQNDLTFPWAYQTYGGPTDLWGETWTREDLYNPDFGFQFSAQRTGAHDVVYAHVAVIKIKAYYTEGPTVKVRCLNQTPEYPGLLPISWFKVQNPVKNTWPSSPHPWSWCNKDDDAEHSTYTYNLSLPFPKIKPGSRAALIHCYYIPGIPSATADGYPQVAANIPDGSAVPWNDPDNALVHDGVYAAADLDDGYTDSLRVTTCNCAVPAGATILGIFAIVWRRDQTIECNRARLRLTYDGGEVTDWITDTSDWIFQPQMKVFGSGTELWSRTWTPTEINAEDFGADFQAGTTNGPYAGADPEIDSIQLAVGYSLDRDWFTIPTNTPFVFT